MSAFICSDFHLSLLARFASERIEKNSPYIDRLQLHKDLADRLKRCNIESVNYRYAHHKKTPRTRCRVYQTNTPFAETFPTYTAAHVYRLFQCWEYQSIEDSNSIDFHALSALLSGIFTPEEKEAAKNVELWAI